MGEDPHDWHFKVLKAIEMSLRMGFWLEASGASTQEKNTCS